MKTITIEVSVTGGTVPVPIMAFIDKVNSNHDILIKRSSSFTETFSVELGEYNVIVSGENPIDGKSVVKVTHVDSNGVTDSKEYTIKNEMYSKIFKVNI